MLTKGVCTVREKPEHHPRANPLLINDSPRGEDEEGESRGRRGGQILIGYSNSHNDTLNPLKHQSEIRK